ncbi:MULTISPECIES: hypothetical protein [unclassified Wolbachia]|nr:hypothetical protein [Wolbachia endosymbiont (group A) of Apoderus coryli]
MTGKGATWMTGREGYLEDPKRVSFQCLTLESSLAVISSRTL